MKALTLFALVLPAVLGTPAPAPGDDHVDKYDGNTHCNPYTDWGYQKGPFAYYCANFGKDHHCVRYKVKDYCSGKVDHCSHKHPCKDKAICHRGICVEKVKGKHCQRDCDY